MARMKLEGLAIALFLLASVCSAFAYPPALSVTVADPLPRREDVTYADLVRLLLPDYAIDEETQPWKPAIEIRHIAGWDQRGAEPKSGSLVGINAVPVRSGGEERLALLLDFGEAEYTVEGMVVLALFDVAGEPRLLDAANVGLDRHTFFPERTRFGVSIGNDLLITRSSHFNAGQHYVNTALILVRDDRLELVDTISTFNESYCAYRRSQIADVWRGAGQPFGVITARVTESTWPRQEECGEDTVPEPHTRTITVTYRWDAATERYVPDSDAFDVLARENEKRY